MYDSRVPRSLFIYGLLAVFVLSGFAGLIYQSIWSHYLGLWLGHAAYAQALVLATFMGGMGLGAALVARYTSGWRNLVRKYAIVELALGVAGLCFHLIFVNLHHLLLESIVPVLPSASLVSGVKWGVAIGLILPQSILLGMSFPLMSAGIMRRIQGIEGRVLGNLYFSNSIGAAAGALAATFILVPAVGLPGAIQIAGCLNLLVGAAAWVLSPNEAGNQSQAPRQVSDSESVARPSAKRSLLYVLLAGTALSSAASFMYEIGWVRMLSLAVGTTLHAFELMLAAFIGGLALGGLWIRGHADKFGRPLIALSWIQLLMGLCALGSLALYSGAFKWVGYLMAALAETNSGYHFYNAGTAVAAIGIMLPAAFFAGATLPLFTTILLRAGFGESVIGKVYACNTFGAIFGVFAAVHFMIPRMGLRDAMIAAAGLDIAIGLVLMGLYSQGRQRALLVPAVVGASLFCVVATGMWVQFDPHRLASGVFRSGRPTLGSSYEMLYYRDGKTASVALFQSQNAVRSIANNGKVDASLSFDEEAGPTFDESTMVLAGALPMGLHADPRRVAVIGFGSGLTTQTVLADPRVENVDTIEIESMMIEAARGFGYRVERAYADPRSNIVIDDAKTVLSGSRDRYDIIISEPSNPWMAGVGNLFADEFYDFIAKRLNPGGLFVQWLQLYEIDEALVGSILSAFVPHFDDHRAWLANSSDLLIVGTRGDPLPALDIEHLFRDQLGVEMRRAGLRDPAQIVLREFADGALLRAMAAALGQPANSYYRPVLTLNAPRTRFRRLSADRINARSGEHVMVLELLGTGKPLPGGVAPPERPHFRGEYNTTIARTLRGVLLGDGDAYALSNRFDSAWRTELLRLQSQNCRESEDAGRVPVWLDLYGPFVLETLPFIDTEGAYSLFVEPEWHRCTDMPALVRTALDFTRDLALRDLSEIPVSAARFLDRAAEDGIDSNPLNELAYLAAQAALISSGDLTNARSFRNDYRDAAILKAQGQFLQDVLGEILTPSGDAPH